MAGKLTVCWFHRCMSSWGKGKDPTRLLPPHEQVMLLVRAIPSQRNKQSYIIFLKICRDSDNLFSPEQWINFQSNVCSMWQLNSRPYLTSGLRKKRLERSNYARYSQLLSRDEFANS